MQDFLMYLELGWSHIVSSDALDHQLFILALVALYSFKSFKKVLILVTAFTLGHSCTLLLSSLDVIRFSTAWIEFLIPCTIVFAAADNLLLIGKKNRNITVHYVLALVFGLIHGMGFANSVRMMLAQEQDIVLPLLGFNVGLEIGQIFVVAITLFVHYLWVQKVKLEERYWIILISLPALILALKMALERIPF